MGEHRDEWMAGWNAALDAVERYREAHVRWMRNERVSLLSEHNCRVSLAAWYQDHPEARPLLEERLRP